MLRRDLMAALGGVAALCGVRTGGFAAEPEALAVALTFDDGPHPVLTPRLLDILASEEVVASFFVIGEFAERHPEIVRRAFAAGHEIGNHSWSHPFLTRLPLAGVTEEVSRTDTLLRDITGHVPNTLRPPYGAENRAIKAIVLPRPLVLWNVDTNDWRTRNAAAIERAATQSSGRIILMHDIYPTTIEAVPAIIKNFKSRGFGFVPVSHYVKWPLTNEAHLERV